MLHAIFICIWAALTIAYTQVVEPRFRLNENPQEFCYAENPFSNIESKHRQLTFKINLDGAAHTDIDFYGSKAEYRLFNKGQKVYVSSRLANHLVNSNQRVQVSLKNLNTEYGSDLYQTISIYHDNKILYPGIQYYINYNLTNQNAYSYIYKNLYKEEQKDNYIVECEYSTSGLNPVEKTLFQSSYDIIEKFRVVSIALTRTRKGIFVIFLNDTNITEVSLDLYITTASKNAYDKTGRQMQGNLTNDTTNDTDYPTEPNTTPTLDIPDTVDSIYTKNSLFERLFVLDQPFDNLTYLVLVRKDSNLLLYSLWTDMYGDISSVNYLSNINLRRLVSFNFTATYIVSKVGHKDNKFFLATSQGIFIFSRNPLSQQYDVLVKKIETVYDNQSNSFIPVYALDMVIARSHAYVAIKDHGVRILKLDTLNFIGYTFILKNIRSLDLVVNPLMFTNYLGIFADNNKDNNEFFIELNIDDESNPNINKLFMSTQNLGKIRPITNDMYFTYFYNSDLNKLTMIRRAMLNNIPHTTYEIDLEDRGTNSSEVRLTSLYNNYTQLNEICLMRNTTSVLVENFRFPPDQLMCKFNQPGFFNITLEKYAEACEESIKFNYAYSFCDFIIYLNFDSIGEKLSDSVLTGVLIGPIAFVLICIIAIIIFCKFYVKKTVHKPKPRREDLYMDNEEIAKYYPNKFDGMYSQGMNPISSNMNTDVIRTDKIFKGS